MTLLVSSGAGAQNWLPVASQATIEHTANVPFTSGAGLLIYGDHAYSGAQSGGLHITDISDPQNPVSVAHVPVPARDVAILEVGDRVIAAAGSNTFWMDIIDITDPEDPWVIERVSMGGILHNVEAVEGEALFYNSRSGSSGVDIVDVSDPDNPELVKVWRSGNITCHDIEAYPEVDRAYCAGLWATYILDISDRLNPVVLGEVDHEEIRIHHWALATSDHNTLIIGDEDFGFQDDGCGGGVHTPAGSAGGTDGAIWLFDITDPGSPQEVSSITPPNSGPGACTAHFGEFIDDLPLLAVGWYTGGVLVIDLEIPALPRVVEQWQTSSVNVWDVQYHDGHLYTGDLSRGMDVLRLDLETIGLPDL